ncbi:MAG: response regulator [Candidatus Edwardsbacteria bacterium]|nr:response regulator [Candidatus Edwardsbacteria bacterium]MBU1577124.1 response regulator [Candidatus Edwardsbacteria bacterium]MBU2463798.1 response regulator [Candidatus Edwardsbacteria bacterium]MBU2593780.1 response regulator [Candidatus Edwardsbacteria bacterium]
MEAMKKILVADDDNNVLFLITELLTRQNYQVFQAVNGDQALREAGSLHPDLMVLDIMMPGIDGIEVCRRIKASPDTRDIRVIMLTAKTSGRDIEAGMAAGADYYLTKPFRINELTEKIKELIG